MRVLVVLPFAPWPVRVRSFNLWPRIAREAEVHVVAVRDRLPAGQEPRLLENVASQTILHFSPAAAATRAVCALPSRTPLRVAWLGGSSLRRDVRRIYESVRPDVVYAERSRSIPLIEGLPAEQVVLDPTDSLPHFYAQVRRANSAPRVQLLLAQTEGPRLVQYESSHYVRYGRVLACSETDATWMRLGAPRARIEIVPNGVDLGRFAFTPPPAGPPRLLMAGNYGYWPNAEAAHWLAEQAPALAARYGAGLLFAGAGPSRRLVEAARRHPYVVTRGYVDDMAACYREAAAVVAPLEFAVGTQNKVLEAMACGRAVAASPATAAGLDRCGRRELFVAERPNFIDAVGEALAAGPSHLRRARAYVEAFHDWDAIARRLLELLSDVALRKEAAA